MSSALADRFREIIRAYCDKQQQDRKVVSEYSIDHTPSEYLVQYVDLSNYPDAKNKVEKALSPADLLVFRNEERFAKQLRFYALVAQLDSGQTVAGLRTLAAAQKPERSKWSVQAILAEGRNEYDELTTDLLLFDEEIDCLLFTDFVFITNKHQFERIFDFYQIRRAVADRALSALEQDIQIHNFGEFREACLRDPRKQTIGITPR